MNRRCCKKSAWEGFNQEKMGDSVIITYPHCEAPLSAGAQVHERPYFMPSVERDRLHGLILKEAHNSSRRAHRK
jgi:hypothetical protein